MQNVTHAENYQNLLLEKKKKIMQSNETHTKKITGVYRSCGSTGTARPTKAGAATTTEETKASRTGANRAHRCIIGELAGDKIG